MYHVIDPTFFYDAINEFSFDYTLYVVSAKTVNEYGKRVLTYTQQVVSGSLQSQGSQVVRSKTGKTDTKIYKFYCKSLYRVNKDDKNTFFNSRLNSFSIMCSFILRNKI